MNGPATLRKPTPAFSSGSKSSGNRNLVSIYSINQTCKFSDGKTERRFSNWYYSFRVIFCHLFQRQEQECKFITKLRRKLWIPFGCNFIRPFQKNCRLKLTLIDALYTGIRKYKLQLSSSHACARLTFFGLQEQRRSYRCNLHCQLPAYEHVLAI
jgi:hypothetical protein